MSRFLRAHHFCVGLVFSSVMTFAALAGTLQLELTEDFMDSAARDPAVTTANWDTNEQALVLAAWKRRYAALQDVTTGLDLGADNDVTNVLAVGDVDGDGHLDVVAGNGRFAGESNKLYLNNGSANPFADAGIEISSDLDSTAGIALGDVDADGDLDVVAGNGVLVGESNKLYLNNGSANPFSDVSTGLIIGADTDVTAALALTDVDGDGDLDLIIGNLLVTNKLHLNVGVTGGSPFGDGSAIGSNDLDNTTSLDLADIDNDGHPDLVTGNQGQTNKLYFNNGTASPFAGLTTGSDIGTNANSTVSIVLGDMDGDRNIDVIAGNVGINRLYLNSGLAGAPFLGQTSGTAIDTDADTTLAIAIADIDGDGDLDVATGNGDIHTNKLYFNNGSGTPFIASGGIPIGNDTDRTVDVVLADIDGDGKVEMIAGHNNVNKLYLNESSTNPFAGLITGSSIGNISGIPTSVAIGDVDLDGDLDVVTGKLGLAGSQRKRLYLNNGTETPFAGATGGLFIGTDTNDATNAVALGDLNGDGLLDVVAANNMQTSKYYLNDGSADPYKAAGSAIGVEVAGDDRAFSVALGDIDRDGDLDVVVGNSQTGTNKFYLNSGTAVPFDSAASGGDIGLEQDFTSAVVLADFDRDGDLDLVTGNAGATDKLYLNDGSSSPFGIATAAIALSGDTSTTRALAAGDIDGDGDIDVVAGQDGETNSAFLFDLVAEPLEATINRVDIGTETDPTQAISLSDVDGDGDLDVVIGNSTGAAKLYLNNGTGQPFAGQDLGSPISLDSVDVGALAMGDLDGDGDPDALAITGSSMNALYQNGGVRRPTPGTGAIRSLGSMSTNASSVAVGDVDGDGDLDVVVGTDAGESNWLYLNDGTSRPFADLASGIAIGTEVRGTSDIALGDIDGDGDLDVVVGNSVSQNRLYLNDRSANPFPGPGLLVGISSGFTGDIELGDIDGDGDLDVVAGDQGDTSNVYLNNGTADPFGSDNGISIGTGSGVLAVALGDVDGDGDLDLVLGNRQGASADKLFLNNGTSDPFTDAGFGLDIGVANDDTRDVALLDLDGDGDFELLRFFPSSFEIRENSGSTNPFSGGVIRSVGGVVPSFRRFELGDVNRDGRLDLVAGNRLHINDGIFLGIGGDSLDLNLSATPSRIALGDMDRDGDLDLVEVQRGAPPRLHTTAYYDIARNLGGTLQLNPPVVNIDQVLFRAIALAPDASGDNQVEYSLSNNGGAQWFQVRSDAMFTFPTFGNDLRWKARLKSRSPASTPEVRLVILNLIDNTAPVVTAPSDISVEASGPTTSLSVAELGGPPTITDNLELDLAAARDNPGPYPVGLTTITWSATDSGGNTGTDSQNLTVVDTTPPAILPSGDNPVTVIVGSLYVDAGASATDLVDGDLTPSIVTDATNVNTSIAGNYEVSYMVADSAGNSAMMIRSVLVREENVFRDGFEDE